MVLFAVQTLLAFTFPLDKKPYKLPCAFQVALVLKFITGSPGPSLLTEAGCAEVPGVMTLLPFLIRARSCWHSHTQSLTLCSSSSALVSLGVGTAGMCSFRQWHVGNFEFVAFKKCYLIELISGSYCKINLNWCDGYKLWKETMQKIILKAPQSLRKHCSRDLKPELGCSITQ